MMQTVVLLQQNCDIYINNALTDLQQRFAMVHIHTTANYIVTG